MKIFVLCSNIRYDYITCETILKTNKEPILNILSVNPFTYI